MKLREAEFLFEDKALGLITVKFTDGVATVRILATREEFKVSNASQSRRGSSHKPCVSHCLELIRMATYKPPATNQAKQRREKTKPALRVADST